MTLSDYRHRVPLRHVIRPALGILAILLVVEYVLIPQVAGARKTLNLLDGLSWWWCAAGVAFQMTSLLAYARLTQLTLRSDEVGYGRLLQIDLSTLAVSHVVPAGSLVGVGLGYRLLTRSGVKPAQAVSGKALQTIGSAVVLNLLLGGGLVFALLLHGGDARYTPIAAAGLGLLLLVVAATVLILRREQRVIAFVTALLARLPHVDPGAGERLIDSLAATIRQLLSDRAFLRQTLVWATLNWMLDALSLWCFVRAFGHGLGPVGLVVAYGLANVAAALPFTPGGLGVVEGILVPTLVAFSTPRGIALLGVLTYRLASFWLPIPVGLACYAPLATHHDSHRKTAEPEPLSPSEGDPGITDADGLGLEASV